MGGGVGRGDGARGGWLTVAGTMTILLLSNIVSFVVESILVWADMLR